MKPDFTEAWDKWSATHNRENYGRSDAFQAGADHAQGLAEARIAELEAYLRRLVGAYQSIPMDIDMQEAKVLLKTPSEAPACKHSDRYDIGNATRCRRCGEFWEGEKEPAECEHRWIKYSPVDLNWHCLSCDALIHPPKSPLKHETPPVEKEKVEPIREALEFAHMTLEHALFLGHLGDGSTRGMAMDAVEKAEKALKL